MLKLRIRGQKGEEKYEDHHQITLEATVIIMGVVIIIMMVALLFILFQYGKP